MSQSRLSRANRLQLPPAMYVSDVNPPRWVYLAWGLLIWGLAIPPFLGAVTAPRFFNPDVEGFVSDVTGIGASAGWFITFGTLGAGAIGILLAIWMKPKTKANGATLWVGAMMFAAGPLLSSKLGTQPFFTYALYAIPLVFTAAYLLPPVPFAWFMRQAKWMLLIYAYGSLGAIGVMPGWALETPYTEGFIPGFSIRLHGITTHANTLAPMLSMYVLLDWISPKTGKKWVRYLNLGVVLIALVMTQSKTTYMLLSVCMVLLMLWAGGRKRRWMLAILAFVLFAGGLFYVYKGSDLQQAVDDSSLTTLTGRTDVWAYTVDLWKQNEWFGYGPSLWNAEMRLDYAAAFGWAPPHSHNQFYQTLGEAGIVGEIGLFLYYLFMIAHSIRAGNMTKGVTVTFTLMMILRGISEPPMRFLLTDGNFYLHLLTYAFLMLAAKNKRTITAKERYEYARFVRMQERLDKQRREQYRLPGIAAAAGVEKARVRKTHTMQQRHAGHAARTVLEWRPLQARLAAKPTVKRRPAARRKKQRRK